MCYFSSGSSVVMTFFVSYDAQSIIRSPARTIKNPRTKKETMTPSNHNRWNGRSRTNQGIGKRKSSFFFSRCPSYFISQITKQHFLRSSRGCPEHPPTTKQYILHVLLFLQTHHIGESLYCFFFIYFPLHVIGVYPLSFECFFLSILFPLFIQLKKSFSRRNPSIIRLFLYNSRPHHIIRYLYSLHVPRYFVFDALYPRSSNAVFACRQTQLSSSRFLPIACVLFIGAKGVTNQIVDVAIRVGLVVLYVFQPRSYTSLAFEEVFALLFVCFVSWHFSLAPSLPSLVDVHTKVIGPFLKRPD
ncbi:transmembrane protein, putative [Bodo saltans]|uniref:Transmembrane protein, putative n=1 Tax=Bodo saltans TaxID=75058 RepID=A0A0S4JWZ6_BODSA|nr:transmembrane protein, putative [Bodo saltans]|eukprot:CUG93973.1 transmembrane protein, putative [Bodo saltans]